MVEFKEAEDVTQAYLKMGIYGINGAGKTRTAAEVAMGLALYLKEKTGFLPPVMMGDSETGATWIRPIFKENGIRFLIASTRSFNDLVPMIRKAEKEKAILIVDSISHFWDDLKLSYAIKRKRFDKKLEFQDYGAIKPDWQEFVQIFLNSNAHIILCGRKANEYEMEEKQLDNGKVKKEIIKAGSKMKAEAEMGYEPALLVEMLVERSIERKKKLSIHKAYVEKDRSGLINGREFVEPKFKVFLPHIQFMNIGGEHTGFDASRNSQDRFDDAGRPDWQRKRQQMEVRMDEIQSIIVKHYPGQTTEEKKRKSELLEKHFGTVSWKRIETYELEDLNKGYESLYTDLEGELPNLTKPSERIAIDDSIPDFAEKGEEKVVSYVWNGNDASLEGLPSRTAAMYQRIIGGDKDAGSTDEFKVLIKELRSAGDIGGIKVLNEACM